ncbi:Hypothetical protein CINCED_3A021452, partial [Cinara cedri]
DISSWPIFVVVVVVYQHEPRLSNLPVLPTPLAAVATDNISCRCSCVLDLKAKDASFLLLATPCYCIVQSNDNLTLHL